MNEKLTLHIAERYLNGENINLELFGRVELRALELLASRVSDFSFLKEIDGRHAEILSTVCNELILDGLSTIDDESARILGEKHLGSLSLRCLTVLSKPAAKSLCLHKGLINGMKSGSFVTQMRTKPEIQGNKFGNQQSQPEASQSVGNIRVENAEANAADSASDPVPTVSATSFREVAKEKKDSPANTIRLIVTHQDVIFEIYSAYLKQKTPWWDKVTTTSTLHIDKDWLDRAGYGVLQCVRVQKLIETRVCETCCIPYRNEEVPDSCVRLDPWEIEAFPAVDAKKGPTSNKLSPVDSRRVHPCYVCDASGEITCRSCNGRCEVTCGNCSGTGQERKTRGIPEIILCGSCDGCGYRGGHSKCSSCNGSGRKQTTRYEEYFVPCVSCRSTGLVTCSTCRGTGKEQCYKCEGQEKLLEFVQYTQSVQSVISEPLIVGSATALKRLHWGALESFVNFVNVEDSFQQIINDLTSRFDEEVCLKSVVSINRFSHPNFEELTNDEETTTTLAHLHQKTTAPERHATHECKVLSQEMGYLFQVTQGKEKLAAIGTKNPARILTLGGTEMEAKLEKQSRFLRFLVMAGCDKMIAATSATADGPTPCGPIMKWFNPILQLFKPLFAIVFVLASIGRNEVGDAVFILTLLGFYNFQKLAAIKKWGVILPNGLHIPGKQKNGNPISYSNRRRHYVYFKTFLSAQEEGAVNVLIEILISNRPEGDWTKEIPKENHYSRLTKIPFRNFFFGIGGARSILYREWALAGPFSNAEKARQWRPWSAVMTDDNLEKGFSKLTFVTTRPAGEHTCSYILTSV